MVKFHDYGCWFTLNPEKFSGPVSGVLRAAFEAGCEAGTQR
jgi:hypothetical protein